MRLLIKEYLLLLKESGELDKLLPDLLLEMDIKPLSKAQVGVRQNGVDLAAVKMVDGQEILFLFVIKQGHLGRSDWQSGQNAIRPTLDEIEDAYLNNNISPEHVDAKKIVVLVTTGDLKQEAQTNWDGYKKNNTKIDKYEFEFWGGDQLAIYIEAHLLNEHALPDSDKSYLRKTLALVGESEYDLSHFYDLIKSQLQDLENDKDILKAFRTIGFALNIVFKWAEAENNLLNAAKAAERVLLWAFDSLRRNKLFNKRKLRDEYRKLIKTYILIHQTYIMKLQQHVKILDGLSKYSRHNALIVESLYEQIGLIANFGLAQLFLKDNLPEIATQEGADLASETLSQLVLNNASASSPCYDSQSIEIALGLLLFKLTGREADSKQWLEQLVQRIIFSYARGRYMPIGSDSFEDLVEYHASPSDEFREKLTDVSSIMPLLMQWLSIHDLEVPYEYILRHKELFEKTTFQLWYPDEDTEELLYSAPAHRDSGTAEAPIYISANTKLVKDHVKKVQESGHFLNISSFPHVKHGTPFLDFVASRHFRTPVSPDHWQQLIIKDMQ